MPAALNLDVYQLPGEISYSSDFMREVSAYCSKNRPRVLRFSGLSYIVYLADSKEILFYNAIRL